MNEVEKIIERYKKRNSGIQHGINRKNLYFDYFMTTERELKYLEILNSHFSDDFTKLKLLEIGAGTGYNLSFFHRVGLEWENIWANELLEERVVELKRNFPLVHVLGGDALSLHIDRSFDIVFQSTVFTSILDDDFRTRLANKIFQWVRPGGILLWYDFTYNNPKNLDVKGIKKGEIKNLFSDASRIIFYRTTLAPPIGRRVRKMYKWINFIAPFLRTHIIAVILKRSQ